MDEKFLYDSFNLYYENAMKAKEAGNIAAAKRNLLLAGESMLKLAKENAGELRRARMDRAQRLISAANSMTVPEPAKSSAPDASADKKSGKEKSEDDSETKWECAAIPDIRFDDVAGLNDVKQSVRTRIILPMQHPELYRTFKKKSGGGILLYGPPGTGKTMIAKAIANEVGATFYSVKCSDIVSKWFGEAEKNVKNLFAAARQNEKAIIFFDEFESLGAKRGGNSTVMARLVPELLAQMQGFSDKEDSTLLLLAATNRPWDIDSAMLRPGRFNELIYVGLPDLEARLFMVRKAFKEVPVSADFSAEKIATVTEGFNGADVAEFCDRVKERGIMRSLSCGGVSPLTDADVEEVRKIVKPSVLESDLNAFRKFEDNRGK